MKKLPPGYYQIKPDKYNRPTIYTEKKNNPIKTFFKIVFKIIAKIIQLIIIGIVIIMILIIYRKYRLNI